MILELNGFVPKEEDLVEVPKILDESGVFMMRYYWDTNDIYYYLEKSDRKVYDDRIVELVKDHTDEVGASSIGLSTYFN